MRPIVPSIRQKRWRAAFSVRIACEIPHSSLKEESVVARYRSVVWSFSVRQIEQHFVDIAPAPAFRRIVAFDHGMAGGMEMRGGVLVWRIVAAADMAAAAADPQMQPLASALQALLAAERARPHRLNAGDMAAGRFRHRFIPRASLRIGSRQYAAS